LPAATHASLTPVITELEVSHPDDAVRVNEHEPIEVVELLTGNLDSELTCDQAHRAAPSM